MRITRQAQARSCAICERTLLMGERATRFSPAADGSFVDVCPLCQDIALAYGWLKEGSPWVPTAQAERRRPRFTLAALLGSRREPPDALAAAEPILRRL